MGGGTIDGSVPSLGQSAASDYHKTDFIDSEAGVVENSQNTGDDDIEQVRATVSDPNICASKVQSVDVTSHNHPTGPLIKSLKQRLVTPEQLTAEVKGIYAALGMVEKKCIEMQSLYQGTAGQISRAVGTDYPGATTGQESLVKRMPLPESIPSLNNDQLKALAKLHITLLNEHHDFHAASHNPSGSTALQNLSVKYGMPERMWRHGIQDFVQLLRHQPPVSVEIFRGFTIVAYTTLYSLDLTAASLQSTWAECRADLGRWKYAADSTDYEDRQHWKSVCEEEYIRALHDNPTVGRLYHHLAVLKRPDFHLESGQLDTDLHFDTGDSSTSSWSSCVPWNVGPAFGAASVGRSTQSF
ncbi:hypothetical protein NKR19_g9402 [Coniochaeta hoffmannii]|uniref:Uncharacterized protein n=1 Tax=Coniochaeta hoffmannii TaxID=91930 RepID=A0AA38RJG3_9PEZI|nr:hypothetical protein NKR19_g9402 [Coniochaeta hoffmannii]